MAYRKQKHSTKIALKLIIFWRDRKLETTQNKRGFNVSDKYILWCHIEEREKSTKCECRTDHNQARNEKKNVRRLELELGMKKAYEKKEENKFPELHFFYRKVKKRKNLLISRLIQWNSLFLVSLRVVLCFQEATKRKNNNKCEFCLFFMESWVENFSIFCSKTILE